MNNAIKKGAYTALITPFSDGDIDLSALRRLADFQLRSGIDGLVVCGTTGEAPTLTPYEIEKITYEVSAVVNKKIPVVTGVGGNCTASAVTNAVSAQRAGADAVIASVPYYNKPTAEGIYRHFAAIADAATIPLIAYNVPSRTSSQLPIPVVGRLAEHGNVAAVKEASGDVKYALAVIEAAGKMTVFSGCDELTLPLIAAGAGGVISVVSNLLPGRTAELCRDCFRGDFASALTVSRELMPVTEALFSETNPIPVKTVLSSLGFCRCEFRLPLTAMDGDKKARLLESVANFIEIDGDL